MAIVKTEKQRAAITLMAHPDKKYILLSGGSRAGKTFILCYGLVTRGLKAEESRHLIARFHHKDVIASIGKDTLPKVLKKKGVSYDINRKDWIFTLQNGSEIWLGGLDDDDRVEKILGMEYSTIYFNEASQIPYHSYSTALTRLAQKTDLVNKVYVDCNPPTTSHWLYKYFVQNIDPETRLIMHDRWRMAVLDMNPADNAQNLPDGYIEETLSRLSERKRRRFRDGEWLADPEGALWKRENINAYRIKVAPALQKVVVGVDPAVTCGDMSNETGIITAGMDNQSEPHFYVVGDGSKRGTPSQWGWSVKRQFDLYKGDKIIAEVNNGGDLVVENMRTIDPLLAVHKVHATRGKYVRAEPVAGLYEQGRVHHVGGFPELEDQMCEWTPGSKGSESPDRMDALVWALWYLSNAAPRRGNVATFEQSVGGSGHIPGIVSRGNNEIPGMAVGGSGLPDRWL